MDETGVHISNLLLALISVAPLVAVVLAAISLRRRPALSEELYKDFVRRGEMESMNARLEGRLDAYREEARRDAGIIFKKIDVLTSSINTSLRDVSKSIGSLEGEIKTHIAAEGGRR